MGKIRKGKKNTAGETYCIIFGKTEDFSGSFLQEDLEGLFIGIYRDLNHVKDLPGNPS